MVAAPTAETEKRRNWKAFERSQKLRKARKKT